MARVCLAFVAALICVNITHCFSKRVIFMPFPMTSQAYIQAEIARAAIDLGHKVWLVLPDTVAGKGVLNTTGMSVIKYHTNINVERDIVLDLMFNPFLEGKSLSPFLAIVERYLAVSDQILNDQELFQEIKSVHADLFVFDDNVSIGKLFVVFPYRLGIPFACVDFVFQSLSRRLAFSPAVVPAFLVSLDQHMTFTERLVNTLIVIVQLVYSPVHVQDVVARYAPEMPYVSLDMLVARAEVWLIQSDPILYMPHPALPNTKYIGGIAASPADNPLTPTFQSFMDNAKDGVIVVSFGSMVKSMPRKFLDKLMAAFLKLRPHKVVFRIDAQSPDPEYVMTSSWLPQNSLLAHPNCRVFVTHCGSSGHYQGVYHAVPMLGLPLFFDQFRNAHFVQIKGFGIKMDIRQVSVQELVDAIRRLLEDTRYKSAVTRASELFREQYGVPAETAAYWLDHVMQYGGDYMRSAAQEMPLYQFLLLDVLGILGGAVGVTAAVVCFCARRCKRWSRKVKEE